MEGFIIWTFYPTEIKKPEIKQVNDDKMYTCTRLFWFLEPTVLLNRMDLWHNKMPPLKSQGIYITFN